MQVNIPSKIIFMYKSQGRLYSLDFLRQQVKENENTEFKPVVLHLKSNLVLHPVHHGHKHNEYFKHALT